VVESLSTVASADFCSITATVTRGRAFLDETHVEQISPDKNVNCDYTTAAFTLSLEPWASSCGANLPGDWALYAVSVRRLIALRSGFLRTVPRGSALAFG